MAWSIALLLEKAHLCGTMDIPKKVAFKMGKLDVRIGVRTSLCERDNVIHANLSWQDFLLAYPANTSITAIDNRLTNALRNRPSLLSPSLMLDFKHLVFSVTCLPTEPVMRSDSITIGISICLTFDSQFLSMLDVILGMVFRA